MIAAHVSASGGRLQTKAVTRPSKPMLLTLPSGTGKLGDMPEREAFSDGDEGMHEWASEVEAATEGFAVGHRAESTFREHESYMCNVSEWAELNGLGAFVRKATSQDQKTFRNIAPVQKDGKMRVLPPQALMAMFSQMATGDPRAPRKICG